MSTPHRDFWGILLVCVMAAGCGTMREASTTAVSDETAVRQRLAEILNAAETRDLPRLDSYHWYGPHFTKFASKGSRLDAEAAREGEHKGLSALTGLKLRTENLQVDVFNDTAVATFIMAASFPSGGETITKRERGTLVFVKHGGSWKIVHEHFSTME